MPNFFEEEIKHLEKIKKNGLYLRHLPHRQHQLFFCTEATNSDPFALEFVGEEFKRSHDFVLPLVEKMGAVLQYASPCLQNNFYIVFAAVSNCPISIFFASDRLKENPTIFRAAFHNGFKNFINHDYITFLNEQGDYGLADWVTSLIDEPNKLNALLTGKNQVQLDEHSRIPSLLALQSMFFKSETKSDEYNDNPPSPPLLKR